MKSVLGCGGLEIPVKITWDSKDKPNWELDDVKVEISIPNAHSGLVFRYALLKKGNVQIPVQFNTSENGDVSMLVYMFVGDKSFLDGARLSTFWDFSKKNGDGSIPVCLPTYHIKFADYF